MHDSGPHRYDCDCVGCEYAREEGAPTDGSCEECRASYRTQHLDGCSGYYRSVRVGIPDPVAYSWRCPIPGHDSTFVDEDGVAHWAQETQGEVTRCLWIGCEQTSMNSRPRPSDDARG